jgi:hypothetical protein
LPNLAPFQEREKEDKRELTTNHTIDRTTTYLLEASKGKKDTSVQENVVREKEE